MTKESERAAFLLSRCVYRSLLVVAVMFSIACIQVEDNDYIGGFRPQCDNEPRFDREREREGERKQQGSRGKSRRVVVQSPVVSLFLPILDRREINGTILCLLIHFYP